MPPPLLLLPLLIAVPPLPVQTVTFDSESLGRPMRFNIILPAGYEESPGTRYPTAYLLHGLTSNYKHWAMMGVPRHAAEHHFIVVMPDAGNSWYANWAKPAEGEKAAYEDFIIKDLIGYVDAHYRTIPERKGRAIGGLSMGGYGALTLGLRHPDLFAAVASQSGAVGFARRIGERIREGIEPGPPSSPRDPTSEPAEVPGFSTQEERTPNGILFETAEQADAHDPFVLATKSTRRGLPALYIDCGTEDRLIKGNLELVKTLADAQLPFTFAESPGAHTPRYWSREVARVLDHFDRSLSPPEVPAAQIAGPAPTDAAKALLDRQVCAWNAKDLDGFLATYWNSPDLVFQSGGDRTRGWEATRDRYRGRYQAEGKEMGTLRFADLEFEEAGPGVVLARGRWSLAFADGKDAGGLFSLVVRKFPEGWKIVADHTSSAE